LYYEDINPDRSGEAGNPIVYTRHGDETPVIKGAGNGEDAAVAIGYPGISAGWNQTSHIVVEGLTIVPVNTSYGIAIYGNNTRNIAIRNCHIVNELLTPPRDHAILVGGAQNILIENNMIEGEWDLGIITTAGPEHVVLRGNTNRDCYGSCIDIQTSYGENQAMLIENNRLTGSRTEDGIQFEPDYTGFDPGSWRGVFIRNNIIDNHAENGIDLKGAAHVVIEGNLIYGNRGDNNGTGNLGGGAGGIVKGDIANTQAHHIIIRKNVVWDNFGGIYITGRDWIVYHNTIIGNNRAYMGPDISAEEIENAPGDQCRRRPGLTGILLIETEVGGFNGSVIKNNIVGGHHQGEVAIRSTADLSETAIDGNCYYNMEMVQLVDLQSNWNWQPLTFSGLKNVYTEIPGPLGEERSSIEAIHPGLVYTGDAPVGEGPFDFSPRSDAAVIDGGVALTQTKAAGSGLVMAVQNASLFSNGYGIVSGDTIQVFSSGEKARITNIDFDTHTITLDAPLTWQEMDGISLVFSGSAPDIGAFEFQEKQQKYPPDRPEDLRVSE